MNDLHLLLETALGASRHHALELHALARRDNWNVDLVEKALTACAEKAHHYRESWAAVKVDTDRQVLEATARALDCTEHGHMISELEKQLHHADSECRRVDRSRREYLTGVTRLQEALHRLQARIRGQDPDLPDLPTVVNTITQLVDLIQKEARTR
ncbi:hypothetical protein [Micromonospora inyonensis]|uniref:Uncharacterized protein n=1 Tax=Micromonospora inyonensis TaxID=47866 RepID=A0A1C6RWQ2_9ACTN|nr:hypothetical protein [Micromonospora inyonensis]SCL21652.1 hypothetical protein GA0074694_3101 [Micromonospora inyonensis]